MDHYLGLPDAVIELVDPVRIRDRNGDDRAARLLRDLEGTLLERMKRVGVIACALRHYEHAVAFFDVVDRLLDDRQALANVGPVDKEAVHVRHPPRKRRHLLDLLLSDEAHVLPAGQISERNVRVALVVAGKEYRHVLRDVLLPEHSALAACKEKDDPECNIDDLL